MPCTIDATVGGAAANSYSTIAEANAYHDAHLYASVWTALTDEKKCQALQMATRLLDAMVEWDGTVVSATQRLLWPRYEAIGANGLSVDSTALPPELKAAVAEYARQLASGDTTADSLVEVQGLKSLEVGPIALEFGDVKGKPVPDAVFYLISHLGTLKQRSGSGSIPLTRA